MRTVGEHGAKIFTASELKIIDLLSDGQFHSGVDLGLCINKSRMAITTMMQSFRNSGLIVNSVKGRGHQLAFVPKRIDSKASILSFISNLYHFDSVESTNLYMLKHQELPDGSVVVSEFQTNGRGRRGRNFINLYGTQLMLSYSTSFSEISASQGLSILVGIAVAKVLKNNGIPGIGIKWPNDIYCNKVKAGGILVESTVSLNGCFVVVGIGLNISNNFTMDDVNTRKITQSFVCLEEVCQRSLDRTKLIADIVHELDYMITAFKKNSLAPFVQDFANLDVYANCMIDLVNDQNRISGKNIGINETGALKVDTGNGIATILCGDMSLRPLIQE